VVKDFKIPWIDEGRQQGWETRIPVKTQITFMPILHTKSGQQGKINPVKNWPLLQQLQRNYGENRFSRQKSHGKKGQFPIKSTKTI